MNYLISSFKKAPRAYAHIDGHLVKLEITRSNLVQGMTLNLILYIDDQFLIGGVPLMIKHKEDFDMRYTYKGMSLNGHTVSSYFD